MTKPVDDRAFEAWFATAILPAAKFNGVNVALYYKEAMQWTWQAALAHAQRAKNNSGAQDMVAAHAQQWRGIESAPKDGTPFSAFILIIPDAEQQKGIAEGWLHLPKFPFTCRWNDETDEYDGHFVVLDGIGYEERDVIPTHWMPLPAAPDEKDGV